MILAYWGARTGIFAAVVAILWAFGWFDIIAVIAAFVVAWLISYLALPGLRLKAAKQMEGAITRSERGIRASHAEEDAEIDGDQVR